MESRAINAVCGVGSFQMGGTTLDAPTFAVGGLYCTVGNKLSVGNYGYPLGNITLYCNGYSTCLNDLSCGGNILLSNSTSSSKSANKVLNLIQNGDTYGSSFLTLTNGTPACGIEVKTTSTTAALSEIFFTTGL